MPKIAWKCQICRKMSIFDKIIFRFPDFSCFLWSMYRRIQETTNQLSLALLEFSAVML